MLNAMRARIWSGLLLLVLSQIVGCATLETGVSGPVTNNDPYESFNRSVHEFNTRFDDAIGQPIARGYVKYFPVPVRRSVSNFFNNLWEPSTILNSLLQGKLNKAADSGGRLLINSTFGVLGLFDAARAFGLQRQQEDLGQTLAVWGVRDGPYLVLPFLGPSNVRDTFGWGVEFFTTDMLPYLFDSPEVWVLIGTRLLDSRASILGLEEALKFQVDPYLFLRESYRQSRLIQINEGSGLAAEEEDMFEDELFEDELFEE